MSSMSHYETLMLARTEITNDELASIERRFEELAAQTGGSIVTFDKWGKYRLAYPVEKGNYGVYVLARFNMTRGTKTTAALEELEHFMRVKCNEIVLRHVTVRLEENAPTAYARPEPVDSTARASNIDSFIKESKNLLDHVSDEADDALTDNE